MQNASMSAASLGWTPIHIALKASLERKLLKKTPEINAFQRSGRCLKYMF